MKWSIISDSSSDILTGGLDFGEIHYDTVPFILRIEDDDFVDDKDVDLEAMLNKMEQAIPPAPHPKHGRSIFSSLTTPLPLLFPQTSRAVTTAR